VVVALDAVEASGIAENLIGCREACLAADVEPSGWAFGKVAGGDVVIDLIPLSLVKNGQAGRFTRLKRAR
jgi:hypothetical protein